MKNFKISIFSGLFTPYVTIPNAPKGRGNLHYPSQQDFMHNLFMYMKTGYYESFIDSYRNDERKKTELPCFTPSGTFRFREDKELIDYTGVMCLDYDNIDNLIQAKKAAFNIPHTICVFISPGGKGVKVFVLTNSSAKNHKRNYKVVQGKYDRMMGVESDKKCCNLSRLCFVSSDRDLMYRDNAEVLKIDKPKPKAKAFPMLNESGAVLRYLYDLTKNAVGDYSKGNRNDFLFRLACNANRYGVNLTLAKYALLSVWEMDKDDFSETEVNSCLVQGYKNTREFGTYQFPKSLTDEK